MGRRVVVAGIASLLAPGSLEMARADSTAIASEWQIFRSRFLNPDGRVIDTGNGGISHSEGQGWGMLLAEAAGDKDSFDLILAWTSTHLARPHDALHVWRYDPAAANPTSDPNNATDGDIFIAWALARGAQRWAQPALSAAAARIAADIRDKLCFQQSGRTLLLPGISGFVSTQSINLNPSYYVLPAFDTLALLAPSGIWTKLRADGLDMLQQGVFGAWSLPPDWLAVSRPDLALAPASAWPPRFSFDAIRVPLWLTWAGEMPAQMGTAFANYWQSPAFPYRPAWIDLQTGAYANFAAPSGMTAIANFTLASLNDTQPQLPSVSEAADYYSAALTLLTYVAQTEIVL
jgi:endoglucanase